MMQGIEIDNQYTAVLPMKILFEKGLVTKQTYINARKRLNLHISPARLFIGRI